MADQSFHQISYGKHVAHYDDYGPSGSMAEAALAWMDLSTVDAWRHERMYELLDPLIQPEAQWLTVGDGRMGSDANFLERRGVAATATDIAVDLLVQAQTKGFIQRYSAENAEALSQPDNSFDIVLCKEAYHHFPRPYIALYEMLRVARTAVCLIEPSDQYIGQSPIKSAMRIVIGGLKRVLGRGGSQYDYEESGNYVFTLSRREVAKVALGLNLPTVAFRGINDAYLPGVGNERVSDRGPLFRRIRARIAFNDALCKVGLLEPGLLCAIIFKQQPPPKTLAALETAGYAVVSLPRNPYAALS